MDTIREPRRASALLMALVLTGLVAACSAGTPAASPDRDGAASPPAAAVPSGAPSAPAGPSVDPDVPVGSGVAPDDDPGDPSLDGPIVLPKPGQLDVRPIPADSFATSVDGRRVALAITFTSGVEPCYVLDSIVVARGEGAFDITLRQGHGPGDNVCIEIAETKRTLVDLGELEPGKYTITVSQGGAAPISVTIA
jgi:hypothetical protein